jgi:hypothetical protein
MTGENDGPVVDAPPDRGRVLLAPPHLSFGRRLWEPKNKLGVELIGLLNVASSTSREFFGSAHLERLTGLGFSCVVVLPGMDEGVEWEVTR